MNWQKVTILAFVLAIVNYYCWPIALVAGAILLFCYQGQEIKNLAGKGIGFAQVLFLSFVIAVAVHAVLTIIFGASFDILYQSVGLYNALKNPDAIQSGVAKEVFALIIVFCATYLVVSSPTPQRWVFKWAIGLSVVALMFQCWNVNAGSQARHKMRLSLLREEILANFDSHIKGWGLSLNRDTVINEHSAEMPAVYFATPDANLYSKDVDGVKRGEEVAVGSRWFHLVDGETIIDKATGVVYEPVASYNDETKHGWLRVDAMSKSPTAKKAVAVSASTPVVATPTSSPVIQKPAVILSKATKAETVALVQEQAVEKGGNTVTVKTGEWVTTGFAPQDDVCIELGRFETMEDVSRLEARIAGGFIPNDLNPKQTEDGRWCAVLNFATGGSNLARHQIELRLKYGLPLSVAVQKL